MGKTMVSSKAATVQEYIDSLPVEKAEVIREMRAFILQHLPEGYQEVMNWGMICYEVPLRTFLETYNKQPLVYAGLAAQKNYHSLYLMNTYWDQGKMDALLKAYIEMNRKPDMGKSCLHFKKPSDLPLIAIGQIIASTPLEEFVAKYKTFLSARKN